MPTQDFKGTVNGVIISDTGWIDYFALSTIVGWAASPTGKIMYKKVGSLVFVKFSIIGTSNATNATFTVPYTIKGDMDTYLPAGYTKDNGVAQTAPGCIRPGINAATVYLYKDLTTSVAWTNSGDKRIDGEFFYEAA